MTASTDERTPEQIERDIEAARDRLAGTVDQIVTRVHPSNLAQRGKDAARAQVLDAQGNLRTQRVAVAVGVVVVLAAYKIWLRRR